MAVEKDHSERLTELLRTAQKNFIRIRSFIRVMDIGLQHSNVELLPTMQQSMREIVKGGDAQASSEIFHAAVNKAISMRLDDAAGSAEAAIIVFGHSVLDYVSAELCKIIAEADPLRWEGALKDRKLKLDDFKKYDSYERALQAMLAAHMAEVERKPLCERIQLICQKCYPGDPKLPTYESIWGGEFVLDLARIEVIDKTRQNIIHRAEPKSTELDFEDTLEYCELTLTYLVNIVAFRFAIHLGEAQYGGVKKLVHKHGESSD